MKWTCGPIHSARALILTKKIAYEYSNNRNWLMSKMEQKVKGTSSKILSSLTDFYCFNIHNVISLWKWGFSWIFLALFKERYEMNMWSNSQRESSYINEENRLWIFKQQKLVNEQNGAKSKGAARQGLSSLTNFYCFNIHNVISLWKWGFSWIFLPLFKERHKLNMWSNSQRESSYINGENRLWIFKQ